MPREFSEQDQSLAKIIENKSRTDLELAFQEIILFLLKRKYENRLLQFSNIPVTTGHEKPVYYPWVLDVDYEDSPRETEEEIGLTATCTYTVKDDNGRVLTVVSVHVDAQGNFSKVETPVEDDSGAAGQIPPDIAEQKPASETHVSIEIRLPNLVAKLKKLSPEDHQRLAQILRED